MRKIIAYYALGVLAILIIWLGIRYLNTGRVIITTTGSNSIISLVKLGAASGQKPIATSSTRTLAIRIRAGNYVARVNSKSFSVSKAITVKAHKTLRYALNPVNQSALEPVAPVSAYSIAASNSSLLYVEAASKILYKIDAQNNTQPVDTSHQFASIKWVDVSYGIGLGTSGQLYSISNGSVQSINLPFSDKDSKPIAYAVSANKEIFVSHGPDIYSGTDAGVFTKIYTTKSPTPSLVSWNNKVAIIETPGDVLNSKIAPLVTIASQSGPVLYQKPFDVDSAAWSQDGKYLAFFSDGSQGEVVNNSLGLVANLPSVAANSLVWAGNALYYTIGNQLWSYAFSASNQLVSSASPGNTVSDLALSNDKAYLYMSVTPDDSSGGGSPQIYRFSLHGGAVPDYVYQLPIFLPDSSQPCSLSYINFTYPTVVGYAASSPDQTCSAAAATVFMPYGIDIGLLHTNYQQISLGENE